MGEGKDVFKSNSKNWKTIFFFCEKDTPSSKCWSIICKIKKATVKLKEPTCKEKNILFVVVWKRLGAAEVPKRDWEVPGLLRSGTKRSAEDLGQENTSFMCTAAAAERQGQLPGATASAPRLRHRPAPGWTDGQTDTQTDTASSTRQQRS